MIVSTITFPNLSELAGDHDIVDVACPICGPQRRSAANRRRKVLRVWRVSATFLSYVCARCGAAGYGSDRGARPPDSAKLAKARAEAQRLAATMAKAKRGTAQWLWGHRRPIAGTIAERYLRDARKYAGELPTTIGFLPARRDYCPAMISAFGLPSEIEPHVFSIATADVQAVHLTRLASDGSAKAGTDSDKIMVGKPAGTPIVLAPPRDLLGLAITEGIEDALSVHEATGLGVWAAGSASLMPALARAVPNYIEVVTIMVDDDVAGQLHADELAREIERRGIAVRLIFTSRSVAA